MITAIALSDKGKVIILGITRENVVRLVNGEPIHVDAEMHPGFPTRPQHHDLLRGNGAGSRRGIQASHRREYKGRCSSKTGRAGIVGG